jgi:hypothetical protein
MRDFNTFSEPADSQCIALRLRKLDKWEFD